MLKAIIKKLWLVLLLIPVGGWAQEEVLTLREALQVAILQNHTIQVALNTAESAENQVYLGNAGLLPLLESSGGATYTNDYTYQQFGGGLGEQEVQGAESTNLNGQVQLSYTLFDGFSNMRRYKQLKVLGELGESQARFAVENMLLQVADAYYNVALQQENIAAAQQAVTVSLDRYRREEARQELGVGSRLPLLNAQVNLGADSVALVNFQLQLENARRNLNLLLARPITAPVAVVTEVEFDQTLELEALQEAVEERNAAVEAAEAQLAAAELDVKLAQSAFYPQLQGFLNYGYSHMNNETGILLQSENRGFTGGLNLSYPIFAGQRRTKALQNAQISLQSEAEELELAVQDVKRNVLNAWQLYQNSLYILRMEQDNVQVAELNFERSLEALQLGQITYTEFREAQLNQVQAETRLAQARYNAKLAEVDLLRLSGRLFTELAVEAVQE